MGWLGDAWDATTEFASDAWDATAEFASDAWDFVTDPFEDDCPTSEAATGAMIGAGVGAVGGVVYGTVAAAGASIATTMGVAGGAAIGVTGAATAAASTGILATIGGAIAAVALPVVVGVAAVGAIGWTIGAAIDYFSDDDDCPKGRGRGKPKAGSPGPFNHQCWLMANINGPSSAIVQRTFADHRYPNDDPPPGSFKYSSQIATTEAQLFIDDLLGIDGLDPIFSARPAELAALMPMVEIYKIIKDCDNEIVDEIPLPLPTFTDPNDVEQILQDRQGRGDDVGLIKLKFDWTNTHAGLIGTLLHVHVSLLFQTGTSLVQPRLTPDGRYFSYLDLVTQPMATPTTAAGQEHCAKYDKSQVAAHQQYNPENYEIKMVIGYQKPMAGTHHFLGYENTDSPSDAFINAIDRMSQVFVGTMNGYDLDFRENGQLVLNIRYLSRVVESIDHPEFDIFQSKGIVFSAETHEMQQDPVDPACGDPTDSEAIEAEPEKKKKKKKKKKSEGPSFDSGNQAWG